MKDLLALYGAELMVMLLSLLAVGGSLFRARAQHTHASAAAVAELAQASQDLRERMTLLEEQNRQKDDLIADLRQQAALIPILETQVRYLTEELSKVKLRHQDEVEALRARLTAKDAEIRRLRTLLKPAEQTPTKPPMGE